MSGAVFDVIIVGGGVMGCSVAYHLLRIERALTVGVVEKDSAYRQASSALSVGNVRIQFSLKGNIQISQFALETVERFSEEMVVPGSSPDIGFRREGNLFLVDEVGRAGAEQAFELQSSLGCSVEWWSPDDIVRHYPWYQTCGYVGATFGPADGYLDGYAFLMGFRRKALSLGADFVTDEVVGIEAARGRVAGVKVADGRTLSAAVVVNCAGAWAAGIARTAGIELPVQPVQRQVFVVEPEVRPSAPLPLTSLPTGLYFRSEGPDRILVGKSLPEDRIGFDLQWQERRFEEILWPELAAFVPVFGKVRFRRGWAGLYAVNTLDGNAVLGEWPELGGFYLANGFSGHGLQQAPAVGRYLAELITGTAPALDLSAFGAERILARRPLRESALV